MTPFIVTNGERFRVVRAHANRRVAAGDDLLELELQGSADGATPAGAPVLSEQVVVAHAHGIHARPAALIARAAKALPYRLEIRARGRGADARSTVALMALGIRGGDEMVIAGFESGAAPGIAQIAGIVRALDATPDATPDAKPDAKTTAVPAPRASTDPLRLAGVVASRGLAAGPAFTLRAAEIEVPVASRGPEVERTALDDARARVRAALVRRAGAVSGSAREVLHAHLELLDDTLLVDGAHASIEGGRSAGWAWRESLRASARALVATGDTRLAERAADLDDLERQVLLALDGREAQIADVPAGAVLVARDLTPSQFLGLATQRLAGIALAAGGPTSHVAILAASQGVPMLVALGPPLLDARDGEPLLLDAEAGTLRRAPDESERAAFDARIAAQQSRRDGQRAAAGEDCRLASGERIEVFANLTGTPADAELAVRQGAEGCGLLRTEFLFMDRDAPPDEREQRDCYEAVARILGGRPLVIRTFDVGGDKPIAYLPLPAEDNPALGLRGIRASLWRPDVFRAQLRALLQVQPAGTVRILLPMITGVDEVRAVRALLETERTQLNAPAIALGVMIETPAAALAAGALAREVDFLSIGTNDLSQYTLAMDRGNAQLAARIDGLHPAVLKLIGLACAAAAHERKPVAVCGGLASDPVAVPLLLGLGVTELSAVPAMIPALKALVRTRTLADCRALAERALVLEDAAAVRALASGAIA